MPPRTPARSRAPLRAALAVAPSAARRGIFAPAPELSRQGEPPHVASALMNDANDDVKAAVAAAVEHACDSYVSVLSKHFATGEGDEADTEARELADQVYGEADDWDVAPEIFDALA